jgi:FixJ family two-component response regulator
MNKPVFFIDDDEYERRSCTDVLNEIFKGTTIQVEGLKPLQTLAEYSALVAKRVVAALIIDERLNTAGGVTYTGAELAAHLRAIGGNLPIVILTNYPDDDFTERGWAVENIVEKRSVLSDPNSSAAQEFKARLSRQVEIVGAVLSEREQRFHDLLIKSLKETLTSDEEKELGLLETERILPLQAEELSDTKALQKAIEELKAKLNPDLFNS